MNDGGPAFPCMWINEGDCNALAPDGQVVAPSYSHVLTGISVRDWFAGQALGAIIASSDAAFLGGQTKEPPSINDYTRDAYRVADAMLAERLKTEA